MKVILVKSPKNKNNFSAQISAPKLQILVNRICRYFSAQKIRNKKLLKQKKELTLVFLNRAEMKKINLQFRKKNKPTDILSFHSHDPHSLGELLLCAEVLKAQAIRHEHSFNDEVTYMLIHGILHLLGYDHEASVKEEKLMFRLQDKCFNELV